MASAPRGIPGGSAPAPHQVAPALWLVASAVPLDVYGPGNLEPRLRDLDWIADVAVAHEAVTEFVGRRKGVVVVPMKMFTMFSTVEKAVADVRARRTAVDRAIRYISGCEEWGIRVTRQTAVVAPVDAPPRTGAAFLRAQKAARDATMTARAEAVTAAETAFGRLTRLAKDAHRRPRRSEPGTNPPILEAAFLVCAGARERFRAEARRQTSTLAKVGADLTVTGPWPAYNFVGPGA